MTDVYEVDLSGVDDTNVDQAYDALASVTDELLAFGISPTEIISAIGDVLLELTSGDPAHTSH